MSSADFQHSERTVSLQDRIFKLRQTLRCGQQQMADWQGGALAISAVPGAGKSTGMAAAVAIAIARQYQQMPSHANNYPSALRQIVVVTFTRSAAVNIKAKISKYLRDYLSLPQTGFAVYTLHGLALNIGSRYPDLSGLELDDLTLITPNKSHRLIGRAVEQWIDQNPEHYWQLLKGNNFDGEQTELLRRQSVLRTEVLPDLATNIIHEAKSSGVSPEKLLHWSQLSQDKYAVLRIAAGLYTEYENLMRSEDLIDYDDMILGALRVLENDNARRLEQKQVFAVFEDEAQDSSPLQTQLLEILALGETNKHNYLYSASPSQLNLVRVGDPNQAINSSFTPADAIYFRGFCQECETLGQLATMDQAGRSTSIIIDAANFVLEWANNSYHHQKLLSFLPFRQQKIKPVDGDDPQIYANPTALGKGLELHTPDDINHTVDLISQRLTTLVTEVTETKNMSGAILVKENRQGRWLAGKLKAVCHSLKLELYDVGERDRRSHVPQEILALLQFCHRPHSPEYLKAALEILVNRRLANAQDLNPLASVPENFLYPSPLIPELTAEAKSAAQVCRSLLRARASLPVYDLISFIALTLNYNQGELATADKLTERINQQIVGDDSIESIILALTQILNQESTVETEILDAEYTRPNQLTIITMHKAKGLDWDYVFIPFLHEKSIPGELWVPPQTNFLGNYTLSEVSRAQLRFLLQSSVAQGVDSVQANVPELPPVNKAWEQAKHLKTAEGYRLLYVAMTRAKRLLWMSAAKIAPYTWSKPEKLESQRSSPVFLALKDQFP